MANLLLAHQTLGPRLKLNNTLQLDQFAAWISMRTNLNKSEVMMMIQEMSEGILYFNSQGTPVKLPGVGTFAPSVDHNGHIKINLRADAVLRQGINMRHAYTGQMRNKANIGLDHAAYKTLWDTAHPDDPLEI